MSKLLGAALIAGFICAGCATVGPDFIRPDLPKAEVEDILAVAQDTSEAGAVTAESLATWWDNLEDPILTQLVNDALAGNLDIRQAQSRVRVARLMVGISRSGLYPQVDGAANYSRSRASENKIPAQGPGGVQQTAGALATGLGAAQTLSLLSSNPAAALQSIPGQIAAWPVSQSANLETDYYRTGFDAAWELDVFGGTRRSIEAAEADADAVREGLNSVWVSLAGGVAQNYIGLRTDQTRLHVAESNLEAQEETLELLESLYAVGLCDELAVQQIRYVVESTRATMPGLHSGIEAAMNALAVLTGELPGSLHEMLDETGPIPVARLKTVTGIPADALRQRPDIRRAERQLAAQTARIGVAEADLYPKFTLTGSIGLETLSSSSLFNGGSKVWSVGPAVSWPIFHAGAIRKNIQVQTEVKEQYLAAYESAVLMAVKEVREALVDYAREQERHRFLSKAEVAAQNALALARDKYQHGLSDFNNVLDAQRSVLAFQDHLAVSEGVTSMNLVRLYKALGGGWGAMEEI